MQWESPLVGLLYRNQLLTHLGLQAQEDKQGGIFVCKRKGKRVPALTQTDYSTPLGSSRWGSSCLCCKRRQHLQVRGRGQHWGWGQHRAGVKSGQPSSQELSVFGESSGKQTKSCSLRLLPYLVIFV